MSLRLFALAFIVLPASWAGSVNPVMAQNNADKLVRVTYPVADLVVPLSGYPGPDNRETLAESLKEVIQRTIAPNTWEQVGGEGSIQYFPFGMAIVVRQREDVQADIARLLEELRRTQDVQVSFELRLVRTSPSMAKHLFLDMDEHGQPVRSVKDLGKDGPVRAVSIDDKRLLAMLTMVQLDDSASIVQAPKLTMFNGQQARCDATTKQLVAGEPTIACGIRYDVLAVLDPLKQVRLTIDLKHYETIAIDDTTEVHVTKAARTFLVPAGRTVAWYLGETKDRQHLFAFATPRVVVVEKEFLFQGETEPIRDGTEEQSAPDKSEAFERLVQRGIDWLDEHDTRRADRMLVRQIVKDAFVFIEAGDHDKARFLASKAKEFNIRFRPGERTPDDVLAVLDIMRALKRSMAEPVKVQSAPEPAKSDAFERLIRKAIEWFDGPTWQPEAGLTLPSPHYLRHPPQYFPPSMPSPLPKELRALEEAAKQRDVTPHRVFDYGVPRELQIPDGERRQDLYAQPFPRAKQAAIEKRLREPISLNFKNVPLRDVVKDLTAASGVPVLLDMRALRRNNIDLDATVSVEVDDVSMNTALDLLFGPLDLGHVIQDDVIIISPNTQ